MMDNTMQTWSNDAVDFFLLLLTQARDALDDRIFRMLFGYDYWACIFIRKHTNGGSKIVFIQIVHVDQRVHFGAAKASDQWQLLIFY